MHLLLEISLLVLCYLLLTCEELQRHVFTLAKSGISTFAVMSLKSLCNSVTL